MLNKPAYTGNAKSVLIAPCQVNCHRSTIDRCTVLLHSTIARYYCTLTTRAFNSRSILYHVTVYHLIKLQESTWGIYNIQIMNGYESDGTDIFMRWKMECSIQRC